MSARPAPESTLRTGICTLHALGPALFAPCAWGHMHMHAQALLGQWPQLGQTSREEAHMGVLHSRRRPCM